MTGKASRSKGQRGERKAAAALGSMGIEAKRAGFAGHCCPDLDHEIPNTHIEVKYQAKPSIQMAYRQATADAAKRGAIPVALTKMVTRKGGEPWLLTFDLVDLWRFVAAMQAVRP